MNGNKLGFCLLAAILLFAAGTVVSTSFAHYAAEKDALEQQSYYNGMAEMHNSMMGTVLSVEEVARLHESAGCW